MLPWSAQVLTPEEEEKILASTVRLLSEVGVVVENEILVELLVAHGAKLTRAGGPVTFPESFVEELLAISESEYDRAEGLESSCLFPWGERRQACHGLEVTAGTYPQYYLDLNGKIRPHTLETVAEMTLLADSLENIDRLGTMGVPSDVPGCLGPLYMRLLAWKYASRKLSGCGEVRNQELIPYICEMGEIIAAEKGEPLRRRTFAEVEMISPLKFTRVEAEIFVQFWKRGLLAGVGFMHSAGGSAPASLAAVVSLDLAESLFVNALYRYCYGWKKLWLQTNSSVLDMKTGMFPFGRPERGLIILAMGQLARRLQAGLWASAVYPDAKQPGIEAGLQASFSTIPAILAGAAGIECFGLLSGAEMNSPVQLVIDNEYAGALKRFARGFLVDKETLAFETIREAGPGGFFAGTEHTLRFYRKEHWQPALFTRETLNAWLASGQPTELEKARAQAEGILKQELPRGICEATEDRLMSVISRARRALLEKN
ncbi:MAG TPA: trimethylamine methyltransferase family protein [bacterium]|nr:trimethylamine methyltransferase family protein [bacterium]HPP12322.1 trimethylamine methyltransferase family protein [bacterium]